MTLGHGGPSVWRSWRSRSRSWAAPAGAFTARFVYTGAEQAFIVPTRVSSLHVVAVGASGGPGWFDVSGGPGGVTVAEVPVTPGETLYVEVGGYGSSAFVCCSSSFNGGGAGGADLLGGPGGGGGGGRRRALRVSPSTFKAGGKALVSYRSDVAGTIKFRVLGVKRSKGRTRLIPAGPSFTRREGAGANRFRFKVPTKLPPGRYRLRATASGPSRGVSAGFRIAHS